MRVSIEGRHPKAFFFDLDGTLFSSKAQRVPESANLALKFLKKNGAMLFTATGRHKHYLKSIREADETGFLGFVTLNGQYCYCGEDVVYHNSIDRRDISRLLDYLAEAPTPCTFLEEDKIYANVLDDRVRSCHETVGIPLPEVLDVRRARNHDVYQVNVYLEKNENILQLMPHCTCVPCVEGGVDIIPSSGNKWVGISHILDRFGIGAEDIAAFGDGENDIEMLSGAGFSVAMGNAPARVKAAARFVTERIDDNGVYNAIRRFWPHLLL